jgi:hypothetical protein
MGNGIVYKTFIYFLCFSFLLFAGGFPRMAAEATERGLPIGEMTSSGEVKFEARENVWKDVEPMQFPVFQGVRIKTGKGVALIVVAKDIRIEVEQSSLFSFQGDDQFHLFQGRISFRIPSGADMSFRVANLSIGKSLRLQATKDPLVSPRTEETVGSITLHPNGSVTVKSVRGSLSIQTQDRAVLAALSPRQSVTIPSITTSGGQRQMLAQVGAPTTGAPEISTTTYGILAFLGAAALGTGLYFIFEDDDSRRVVIPPTSP